MATTKCTGLMKPEATWVCFLFYWWERCS